MKKKIVMCFFIFCLGCLGLFIAGCDDPTAVATPKSISYDGETISWSVCENATSYILIINEGEEKNLISNSYSYRISETANTITISVQAVNGENKSDAFVKTLTRLTAIDNVTYSNGKFDWEPITNATSYSIRIDGSVVEGTSLTEYEYLTAGTHTFSVRPINDDSSSYFSIWSTNLEINILNAPTNVRFDFETKVISWDAVSGASSYAISINDSEVVVNSNRYEYTGEDKGEIGIKVKAIAPIETSSMKKYDSKYTDVISYTFLDKITEVNMEDGILTWTSVNNATHYNIKIMTTGETTKNITVNTNQYSGLQSGKSYTVEITAYGEDDTYCPTTSNALSVNILAKPTLTFSHNTNANSTEANVISWSPSNNESTRVGGYTLKIVKEGEIVLETSLAADVNTYSGFQFKDVGIYSVSVKANANGNSKGDFDSQYSDVWTVNRLSDVKSAEVIGNNSSQPKLQFSSVTGAIAYSVKLNGTEIYNNLSRTEFNINFDNETQAAVTNKYTITAIANTNNLARTSSLPSHKVYEISVMKLATPNKPTISGTTVSFNEITNASKYEYSLDNNATEISNNSFALPGLAPQDHELKVRALSASSNVIASNYSETLSIWKLATPTNVKITSGILTWGSVQRTTNFAVYMGDHRTNVDNQTQWEVNTDLLSVTGVGLYIYARGNGSDIIDSENSKVLTIYQLQTPTGLMADDDNIKWNQVSNASSYKVLINGNDYYQSNFTASNVPNNQIVVGNQTVSVKAIGDNSTYFDSNTSNILNVTKLATPEIGHEGNKYTWGSINGAAGYLMTIDDASVPLAAGVLEFDPQSYFTTAKSYNVGLRAVGNQQTTENVVISSNFVYIEQVAEQIKTPKISGSYDPQSGVVTVEVTSTHSIVSGYTYYASSINKGTIADKTYTEVLTSAGEYSYTAKVNGNLFDDNGKYYLTSDYSSAYTFTILQPVNNLEAGYNDRNSNNYTIEWDPISNQTVKYLVTIKVNGQISGNYNSYEQTSTSVIISVESGSTVVVTIVAVGNGTSTFDSLPTEKTFTATK